MSVTDCNGTIIMLANCNSVETLEDEISTVSSLVWGKVTDIDNIILDDVYYNRCDSVKGGNLPLTLTVTNSGNNTVNGFVAEITDSEGNTVITKSFDESISSGETIETEISIEIDDNFSYGIYTVKIHSDSVNDVV